LTFQEYYAARWLVARPLEAPRRIRRKLHDPRWQEPILLAVGFYGMEFPDGVDDLIEAAILGQGLGGPSPYEEILRRDLLFAVRCLGDQDVSVGLQEQLIGKLVECWLDPEGAGKYRPLEQNVERIARALRDSPADVTLRERLFSALGDESESVRGSAADALRNATLTADAVAALLGALGDESEDVRGRAAYALSNFARQPAAALLSDLPERLAASLQLPGLDVWSPFYLSRPKDSLFAALAAVAPGPQVD
jgi:hypothetical protein